MLGSELIGQPVRWPGIFLGPAVGHRTVPYNAASPAAARTSGRPILRSSTPSRRASPRCKRPIPENTAKIPVDLVTSSGSGLDPHISPAAAEYQMARVAKARNLAVDEVRSVVAKHTAGRTLGVLGEPRVNVLLVNLELDKITSNKAGGL